MKNDEIIKAKKREANRRYYLRRKSSIPGNDLENENLEDHLYLADRKPPSSNHQAFLTLGMPNLIMGAFSRFTYLLLSWMWEDVEIACDCEVLAQGYPKRQYGELILQVSQKSGRTYLGETALARRQLYSQLKRRIEAMNNVSKSHKRGITGLLLTPMTYTLRFRPDQQSNTYTIDNARF